MLLVSSRRFEEHETPPGHPERPERAVVFSNVARMWRDRGTSVAEPRAVTKGELALVHDAEYIDLIDAAAGRAVMLDGDTFTSPDSRDVAMLAAGAAVQASEYALDSGDTAFALVRPPGHHAERQKAMGFCFYNNIAIAAAAALRRGLTRIAIVDIDVHHGNGTQWSFYDDPRVLYISSHQYPFYPGTGAADEVGQADGRGFTVNIPLEAGSTDADFDLVYRAIVEPVLEEFAAELTLISVGYDAHEADPLASMRMTARGYARILRGLKASALRSGALALVTEGGYDLSAIRECLDASLAVLDAGTLDAEEAIGDSGRPTPRGERALTLVRSAQSPFWPGL